MRRSLLLLLLLLPGCASQPLSGEELDRAFVEAVLLHQEAGVEMSELVVDSRDPMVATLAADSRRDQQREIAQLRTLAMAEYDFDPEPTDPKEGELLGLRLSLSPEEMVERVASAPEERQDDVFLDMMLSHHATTLLLASEVVRSGKSPDLRDAAEQMIASQASDIAEVREIQDTRTGHTSGPYSH